MINYSSLFLFDCDLYGLTYTVDRDHVNFAAAFAFCGDPAGPAYRCNIGVGGEVAQFDCVFRGHESLSLLQFNDLCF